MPHTAARRTGFARNGLAAPPQARLPFGESFADRVAAERRLLTHRHVTSDPTARPQARAFGAESAAGVPLLSGQRLVGVLVVASRADKQFCRDETNLLELVGQRLTNAIVNSSLYEDAREANRLKDRFLSVASHQLCAPITGILGGSNADRTNHQRPRITSISHWGTLQHFGHEFQYADGQWQRRDGVTAQLAGFRQASRATLAMLAPARKRDAQRYTMADHAPHRYIAALRPAGRVTEFGDQE